MSTTYGLTNQGYVPKPQAQIISEITTSLQAVLGANINLAPTSVLSQIIGILSEGFALVWMEGEAIYASQYPAGAEGTSVDNILALNNLQRLLPTPTTTNPNPLTQSNGITLNGLILGGTPGAVIPFGSIIQTTATPPISFTLNSQVTIGSAVNAIQTLIFSNIPASGNFVASIVDPAGNTLTTPSISYNANTNTTQLIWTILPTTGNYYLAIGNQLTGAIAWNANAAAIQSAITALTGYTGVTTSGTALVGPIVITWGSISQPVTSLTTELTVSGTGSAGNLVLNIGGVNTANIAFLPTAAQIQAAIQAISGYSGVGVTGTTGTGPFFIDWGWVTPPAVTITTNPTSATYSVNSGGLDNLPTVSNSVQAAFNTLYDSVNLAYPYSDVLVTGSYSIGMTVTFGGGTLLAGQVTSGAQPQPQILEVSSTLNAPLTTTGNVVNTSNSISGLANPNGIVVGIGITGTGIPASTTVLSISGTTIIISNNATASNTGVTLTFSGVTTETNFNAALNTAGTAAQGVGQATCTVKGPNFVIAGTLTVVGSPVSGWTSVNNQLDCLTGTNLETDTTALVRRTTLLSDQANGPIKAIVDKVDLVSGVTAALGFQNIYKASLQVLTFSTIPTSGSFQLVIGLQTSASISYSAVASTVQTAVQNLTGYSNALVTGNFNSGFTINFNGSFSGAEQALASPINNTLNSGVAVTIAATYGRSGKSFEIVVLGGTNANIAQAIYNAQPAGIESYGNTTVTITDSYGNPYPISFSRPTSVPIYVVVNLITDIYTVPGNPSSGANISSKFNISSIQTIQNDIIAIGNQVSIGGTIIGFGTNGLIGAFNSVPGIVSYVLNFGISANPTSNANISIPSEQIPQFESFNVVVTYI